MILVKYENTPSILRFSVSLLSVYHCLSLLSSLKHDVEISVSFFFFWSLFGAGETTRHLREMLLQGIQHPRISSCESQLALMCSAGSPGDFRWEVGGEEARSLKTGICRAKPSFPLRNTEGGSSFFRHLLPHSPGFWDMRYQQPRIPCSPCMFSNLNSGAIGKAETFQGFERHSPTQNTSTQRSQVAILNVSGQHSQVPRDPGTVVYQHEGGSPHLINYTQPSD